jgi:hypothetical protein
MKLVSFIPNSISFLLIFPLILIYSHHINFYKIYRDLNNFTILFIKFHFNIYRYPFIWFPLLNVHSNYLFHFLLAHCLITYNRFIHHFNVYLFLNPINIINFNKINYIIKIKYLNIFFNSKFFYFK